MFMIFSDLMKMGFWGHIMSVSQEAVLAPICCYHGIVMALTFLWPIAGSQLAWKHGKLCSVGFQKAVPAARLQSPRRPVKQHVYWCFLVTDSRVRRDVNTCWPVQFTAPGCYSASPQPTAGYLITGVSPLCCVCGELAENLRNLERKSES